MAIEHAFMIIGISENLLEDETPEPWVWMFNDELNDHLEDVKRMRNEKAGGK